jgi:chromosome segregation ATPase
MSLRCEAQHFLDINSTNVSVQQRANHMQTELAALQVQLSSANSNVDRLTSSLEDVQADLAEKEQLNNGLQQEKATLKAQVGKRKLLDERGGAEMEELHKQYAILESQVKQLESRVTEEQNKASTHEKALQKERKNTEKMRLALEEQSVRTRIRICFLMLSFTQDKSAQADEESTLLEQQSQHYKDELEKALRQIKQLKAGKQTVWLIP